MRSFRNCLTGNVPGNVQYGAAAGSEKPDFIEGLELRELIGLIGLIGLIRPIGKNAETEADTRDQRNDGMKNRKDPHE